MLSAAEQDFSSPYDRNPQCSLRTYDGNAPEEEFEDDSGYSDDDFDYSGDESGYSSRKSGGGGGGGESGAQGTGGDARK